MEPSELRELISPKPEIAPNDCSSGMATLDAMVSGLAPGKLALMDIMGKSICGSGATGSCFNANSPVNTMAKQIKVVATGRIIKAVNQRLMRPSVRLYTYIAASAGPIYQKTDKSRAW